MPPIGRSLAALLVAAVVVLGCAAGEATRDDGQLRVVASMSVLADLAEQVGGDRVEVTSLVPVGGDPHVHEPTPSDARAIDRGDLLLANGVGLEPWFDALAGDRDVLRVAERLADELVDDADGEPDPHLWMVPAFAATYAQAIADELAALDPDHADAYGAAADRLREELTTLDEELADRLAEVPAQRRVLITPHDAYAYFADHYGFEVATVVGISTEEEPSAAAVRAVVDLVRERDVPTVFVEFTVDPSVIERVAADAGAAVGDPLYGDSLGPPGSGADGYVGMLRANVEAIVAGLAD